MSTRRQMVHLVPRRGDDELAGAVAAVAERLSLVWLERMADVLETPGVPFVCSVEAAPSATGSLTALVDEVGELVDAAASVALEGEDFDFVECAATPIRYQYLMRRRHDFSHTDYLARYGDVHSQFGIATPGIEGYTQFHVDAQASEALASRLGFGTSDVDSVSELHLLSLEKFFGGLANSAIGEAAVEDEERFVDRSKSTMYTSAVNGV